MNLQTKPLFQHLILSIALSTPTQLFADDGSNMYGAGLETCGSWVKDRAESSREQIGRSFIKKSWIQGYVSGVDAYISRDESFYIRNVDTSAIVQWVDGYCRDNPLDELWAAADELIKQLVTSK